MSEKCRCRNPYGCGDTPVPGRTLCEYCLSGHPIRQAEPSEPSGSDDRSVEGRS